MRSTSRDQDGTIFMDVDSAIASNNGLVMSSAGILVRFVQVSVGDYHCWFDPKYVPVNCQITSDRVGSAAPSAQEPGHIRVATYNAAGAATAAYPRIQATLRVLGA